MQENKVRETTFTDNNDKTANIKRKGDPSTSVLVAELDLTVEPPSELKESPENEKAFTIEDFIRRNYDGNFKLDILHNDKAIELLLNVDKTNNNNITFKPLTSRNNRGKPQIVLKRDCNGVLQYNDAAIAKKAVEQFKTILDNIIKNRRTGIKLLKICQ